MSAKQKMAIGITALCLVAVVAIVTVIAVFAANQQQFTSAITVTYTVEDVQGTASAMYYGGKGNPVATGKSMTKDGSAVSGGNDVLTFDVGNDLSQATLKPQTGDVKLTSTDNFVVFEYKFTNTSSEHAYTVTLTFEGNGSNNVKVRTLNQTTAVESDNRGTAATYTTEEENINSITVDSVNVATEGEAYIYVYVEIDEVKNDAKFAGSFNFLLKQA